MCSGAFRDDSMDCIRKELEDVDMCSVIGIYHSIGGGTGSGLGTRITEEIRDEVHQNCSLYFRLPKCISFLLAL